MKEFLVENPLFLQTLKTAMEIAEQIGYLNLSNDLKEFYEKVDALKDQPLEVSEEEIANGTFRAILAKCTELNKKADKIGVTFSIYVSVICDSFDIRAYTSDTHRDIYNEYVCHLCSTTIAKRIFAALDRAEKALEDFKVNEVDNIESEISALNEKLTEAKKRLKAVKK